MTRSPWQRRLLSALLAASVVAAGLPGESWAQARPDLELTYGGLLPDKLRLVKFTVKNVGTAPSSATNKVGVITSEPEPTPSFQGLDLPALKPGESKDVFYTLAADCNGHVVQALVNDPLDLNTANNAVEDKQVCSGAPVATSPEDPFTVEDYATCATCNVPAEFRPGLHTLSLPPAAFKTLRRHRVEGDCYIGHEIVDEAQNPPFPLMAGFRNISSESPDLNRDCQTNGVWHAAFRFNLSEIRGRWAAGRLSVLTMELTFEETPYLSSLDGITGKREFMINLWRPPTFDFSQHAPTETCWPRLARPTVDWSRTGIVVPNDVLLEAGQIGTFPLLHQIGDMLRYPENDGLGFLILGHNEEMHFNDAECVSKIDNVTLNVTYHVH